MNNEPMKAEHANRLAVNSHRMMLFAGIKKVSNEGKMRFDVYITKRENEELIRLGYKVSNPGEGERVITWSHTE